jgi:hypothetical protein
MQRLTADSQAFALWVASLAPWKVIGHYTFTWNASLWSARRVYERFMLRSLPSVSYFYAVEQNPGRAGYHLHSLWDSREAPRKATHREWLNRYGRNRIEPVRNFGDVVQYCSKYVCKERVWWDFHLSRSRFAACRRTEAPAPEGNSSGGVDPSVPLEPVGDLLESGISCGNQLTSATPDSLGQHDRTVWGG